MNFNPRPFEPPPTGRCSVISNGEGVRITVPPQRNYLVIAIGSCWLMGWAVGWCFAVGSLSGMVGFPVFGSRPAPRAPYELGGFLFMLGWLGFWTFGGAMVVYTLAKMWVGTETLQVNEGGISYEKRILLWSRVKRYAVESISNPRTARSQSSNYQFSSCLAFDYGSQTVRVLTGVDEAEIRQLLGLISKDVPGWTDLH